MTTHLINRSYRSALLIALAVFISLFAAQTAQAAITPIDTGEVRWGFKESFRNYIEGPAAGSVTAADGASYTAGSDYVAFPVASGGFDADTRNLELSLDGSVTFYGHAGALNLTIEDLRVSLRDGASMIRADITSIPMGGGPPEVYNDINLAKLDLTAKTPTIVGGTTTWTAIPAKLTAQGAPAFGGFYNAGAALDPVTISYTGPGGVPLAEAFTPPNTPFLSKSDEVTAASGNLKSFYDATHDVIHVIGSDTLTTYDAATLDVKATLFLNPGESFWEHGNAFDPARSTIFTSLEPGQGSGIIVGYVYTDNGDGTGQYSGFDINIPAARSVVWDSANDRLYAIATNPNGNETATVAAADLDESGLWNPRGAYENITLGDSSSVLGVAATTEGKLVGTYAPTATGTTTVTLTRKPIFSLNDTGNELVPTTIPGTQLLPADVTYGDGSSAGYQTFTPLPNGSIAATEQNFYAPSRQMITLDPTVANSSGFAVNSLSLALPFQPSGSSFDANGDLYLGSGDDISLYRDGDAFASADALSPVRDVTGGEDRVFAVTGASAPYTLSSWTISGYSPTITTQPDSESITVDSSSEEVEVSFDSAASGTPAPTVRWQARRNGEIDWMDIATKTSPSMSIDVTAADDGTSYRAIYTNAAGEIATTSAQLAVTVNDTEAPVVSILTPQNGSSTTAESATLTYSATDNDDTSLQCTIANGASVALNLGANSIGVTCVDNFGNTASATTSVTRNAAPPAGPPAPAAPSGKNGKSVKLKYKKGKSVKVTVGTITCASSTTCVYSLPKSIKFKIGKKSYKANVAGPKTLEPGKTQKVVATVPASAIKALKRKKSKLSVSVQVANSAGVKHGMAMSIISKISA